MTIKSHVSNKSLYQLMISKYAAGGQRSALDPAHC